MATEDKSITEDDLANLTAEERAALEGEDGGEGDDQAGDDADADDDNTDDKDGDETDEDDASADDGDDPAADDDAADAPGRDDGAAAEDAASDEPSGAASQTAPILVVEAPADSEAKLAEIATKKEALIGQFDDGDITAKEYQTQLDALGREERKIERAIDQAELAAKMESQRQMNDWINQAQTFAKAKGYSAHPSLFRALDMEVRDVVATPEGKAMNGEQILAAAHANLIAAGIMKADAPAPKPGVKAKALKPDLPPNLARVPSAETSGTDGGRFAALDRLQSSDPIAYEEKLMTMSDADRNAYLKT